MQVEIEAKWGGGVQIKITCMDRLSFVRLLLHVLYYHNTNTVHVESSIILYTTIVLRHNKLIG